MPIIKIKDFNKMTRKDLGAKRPLDVNKIADRAYYICHIIESVCDVCTSKETQEAFRSWRDGELE